jgi:hypothetical protein
MHRVIRKSHTAVGQFLAFAKLKVERDARRLHQLTDGGMAPTYDSTH